MDWRSTLQKCDREAVRALVTETGFFSPDEQDVAVELVDETLLRGKASGYEFIFVDMPGDPPRLMGYVCFGPIPATQGSFDLYWIAVAPASQRSGLGARLIREAERLAKIQGATQMFVDTRVAANSTRRPGHFMSAWDTAAQPYSKTFSHLVTPRLSTSKRYSFFAMRHLQRNAPMKRGR
ncbi:MAG: GNAT family N-acetyltransferase [Proteobacteria bacterium]|nr:GNAT family N-acetyltransferase [Pseudomonadota bacterium]